MQLTVVQLGGVLVLGGLFVLLRRFMLRRAYFSAWTTAWIALAGALSAIVVRYDVLPGSVQEADLSVRVVYYVYLLAKLAMLAWLVDGTRLYAVGRRGFASWHTWAAGAAYSTLVVVVAGDQAGVVVWQVPLALAAFTYCAWRLLSLPRPRRSPGTSASGIAFVYLAALWTVYALVFGLEAAAPDAVPMLASFIIDINPLLDLTGSIALGYGMILILMEDAKREVDDAQAALRAAHDDLRRAALHDPLTGVMNRSAFTEGLGLDMARASFGTVVLLDLDNLKQVNDEFGHAGGDILLRTCADALRAALRPSDRVYRWGGDEFLLVLPSARAVDVQHRFERVIADAAPLSPDNGVSMVRLAASIGASDFASYDDLRAAINRADTLMYRQKHERKRAAVAAGVALARPEPADARA